MIRVELRRVGATVREVSVGYFYMACIPRVTERVLVGADEYVVTSVTYHTIEENDLRKPSHVAATLRIHGPWHSRKEDLPCPDRPENRDS